MFTLRPVRCLPGKACLSFLAVVVALNCCGCGDVESTQSVFRRGYRAFQDGDNSALHQSISRLDAIDATSDEALLLGALVCERGKDYLTALKLMSQVDSDGPFRQLVLLHGGICYHQSGLLSQAARMLQLLTAEFPDDVEGHRWAGIVYYDLGAYDFAIVHLKRVSELDPQDYGSLRLLGIMYCDFERNEEAIAVLTRALKLELPQTVRREMVEQLGKSLVGERRYAEALEAVKDGPATSKCLAIRAECLVNLDDQQGAWAAVDEALRLDGRNRDALFQKASMLRLAGRLDEAVDVLAELVELDPFDAESRYQYGLVLRAVGMTTEAEKEIQEWQRQKTLADELTRKNVEVLSRPFDASLRMEIGTLCEQLGKTDLATMWFRAAAGSEALSGEAVSTTGDDQGTQ